MPNERQWGLPTLPKDKNPSSWLPAPPWEGPPVPRWMLDESQEESKVTGRVATADLQAKPLSTVSMGGPGCKAADSCLLVHGYLLHLAEGKTGFGVLRVAKERLEEGAASAEWLGKGQLAAEMREVAQALPEVHTAAQAAALAPRLKELSYQTWDLGRRCGDHFSPELMAKAQALGSKVARGERPRDQAVAELRESIKKELV